MGDFDEEPHDHFLIDFCDVYNLRNLIKVPTCFKNPARPTSIDVISIHAEVFRTHVELKRDYQIFII